MGIFEIENEEEKKGDKKNEEIEVQGNERKCLLLYLTFS